MSPGSFHHSGETAEKKITSQSSQTREVELSITLKNDVELNTTDGTRVDQGKSGKVHSHKGLAIKTQGKWVMARQELA